MNDVQHNDVQELLGAFALDALSPLEHRRVERHLASCEECTREARLLREAATELAWIPSEQSADELIDRITGSLRYRPRRVAVRFMAAVAAASVAASLFVGVQFVRERSRNAELTKVLASAGEQVTLQPQQGFDGRGVLHIARGKAALVLSDVPSAGRGRAYQLWAIAGGKPRSMTVIGGHGRVFEVFDWTGDANQYAVTIEPEGGSPVPTTNPVLASTAT